jgi:MerR family mercuric resistance operon transcriptional regulator
VLAFYNAVSLYGDRGAFMIKTISVLAKEVDVGIETIRFYEQKGLITQPLKPVSGYRIYPQDTVKKLLFIKRAKVLGFTLEEIKKLIQLNNMQCDEMAVLAKNKLVLVRDKIAFLLKLENSLEQVVSTCYSNTDQQTCPTIKSLYI